MRGKSAGLERFFLCAIRGREWTEIRAFEKFFAVAVLEFRIIIGRACLHCMGTAPTGNKHEFKTLALATLSLRLDVLEHW